MEHFEKHQSVLEFHLVYIYIFQKCQNRFRAKLELLGFFSNFGVSHKLSWQVLYTNNFFSSDHKADPVWTNFQYRDYQFRGNPPIASSSPCFSQKFRAFAKTAKTKGLTFNFFRRWDFPKVSKGSPLIFLWYFATNWIFNKPKGSSYNNFRPCEFFSKWLLFVSKVGCGFLSGPVLCIQILFFKTVVFSALCDFSLCDRSFF